MTYGTPCHARSHSRAEHTHMTYGTPCHAKGHFTHTHPALRCDFPGSLTGRNATPEVTDRTPREAEDFPRGDKHFKHVPPPTYLIYLSPKSLYWFVPFKAYLCRDL